MKTTKIEQDSTRIHTTNLRIDKEQHKFDEEKKMKNMGESNSKKVLSQIRIVTI